MHEGLSAVTVLCADALCNRVCHLVYQGDVPVRIQLHRVVNFCMIRRLYTLWCKEHFTQLRVVSGGTRLDSDTALTEVSHEKRYSPELR